MIAAPQTLFITLLLGPALLAGAQTVQPGASPAATTPPLSPTEQKIQDIKNPLPWLSWGADFRVRAEYFDNIITLTPDTSQNPGAGLHEQSYFRFRSRLWASVTPVEDLSFNVRVANEAREWLRPAGYTSYAGQSGLDMREGIFDTLNVQWRNIFQQPAALTVGRQDIFLGDGWLVGDGTPFDGSWTYYLDSARFTYNFKEQHTTIEAIGIIQDAHDNGWLETLNADQYLFETEQNEKGAILWVANKSVKEANLDTYFIYKHDDAANDIPAKYHPDNADIYTFGGRLTGLVGEHWKYSAEGAYQFGEKQDPSIQYPSRSTAFRDINAFAVNSKASYLFKDSFNNQVNLAYEFLTGDNPKTQDDEMFDNLWGRWPRWSEIGLYSFAVETRIGNEANLHRLGPGWNITPVKNMDFSANYFALFAQEEIATRGLNTVFAGNSNLPGHGLFRGHFLQTILKYKFSKHLSGHLWAEVEFPGDYYASHATWYFLRPEVMFTF